MIAEPDLAKIELTSEHKYVVIASAGVWEVLSNQQAIDILSTERSLRTGCLALVREACRCAVRLLTHRGRAAKEVHKVSTIPTSFLLPGCG